MSVFVVDASLVVKWFVPEVHSVAARKWLDASHDFIAPDLMFPQLITGDDRFARKLAEHRLLAPHVRSVEDHAAE